MFRTKSLNNQQMNNLIQRNRPSRIHKQNRNYSLRTLISDKTIQYHRHMEKLIKQTNQLIFSNKKSNKKLTPSRVLENATNSYQERTVGQFTQMQNSKLAEIGQFQSEIQYVQMQSVPTCLNQNTIEEENQLQMRSCLDASKHTTQEHKSQFKVTLENQQLIDENKELRRQIQHLQHRLETAELIKIQKQSESQSLKLKIKILELKILDFQQKNQERRLYHTKFAACRTKNIQVSLQQKEEKNIQTQIKQYRCCQIQTAQTNKQISDMIDLCAKQAEERNCLESNLREFESFLLKFTSESQCKTILNSSRAKTYEEVFTNACELITQQKQKYSQTLQNQKQQSEQTHKKLLKKISTLVNLLGLAQNQIKSLLSRLRQAKDHDVANYKQMITKMYQTHREMNENEKIKSNLILSNTEQRIR